METVVNFFGYSVVAMLPLLPLILLIFLFVKLNRMERKLDGALERLRDIQRRDV